MCFEHLEAIHHAHGAPLFHCFFHMHPRSVRLETMLQKRKTSVLFREIVLLLRSETSVSSHVTIRCHNPEVSTSVNIWSLGTTVMNHNCRSIHEEGSIVTWLCHGLNDGCLIPGEGKDGNFFLCHRVQTDPGAHSASYLIRTPGTKRPGPQADHLSPYSAKVKNAWRYSSTPPTCLHDVVLN
jgi:hypothetical protein